MIKPDPNNYRKHNKKNKDVINKSLVECGAGRSILIDSEDEIIAGNGVNEEAEKLKIPIRIIETDGKELIAIKRTDLKPGDEKRKKLALLDNHTSDLSTFDFSSIKVDFETNFLKELNVKEVGYFQNNFKNESHGKIERIPYPITIVVTKDDYEIWQQLKNDLNEPNDLKAFIKVIKKLKS
jgi:hypothetical protein